MQSQLGSVNGQSDNLIECVLLEFHWGNGKPIGKFALVLLLEFHWGRGIAGLETYHSSQYSRNTN
jgi:hypothetical protein